MANHSHDERADRYTENNARLRAQLDDMVKQRDEANKLLFEAGKYAGQLNLERDRLRAELIDAQKEEETARRQRNHLTEEVIKLDQALVALRIDNEQHVQQNVDTIMTMNQMRFEGGLIVHALDCAIQLNEQLFIFLPEGTVMPNAVASCRHLFTEAMRALGHRKEAWTQAGNTSSSASPEPAPSTASMPSTSSSTPSEPTAGSLSSSPTSPTDQPTPSPSSSEQSVPSASDQSERAASAPPSESEMLVRGNRALAIAGYNIAELQTAGAALTAALNQALLLVDQLIAEMRRGNVTPSGVAVVAKARLDQEIRKVLALKSHGGLQ